MSTCFSYCEIEVVNVYAINNVTGGVIYALPLKDLVTILSNRIFSVTLLILFRGTLNTK
jgi:hypothetical protein